MSGESLCSVSSPRRSTNTQKSRNKEDSRLSGKVESESEGKEKNGDTINFEEEIVKYMHYL